MSNIFGVYDWSYAGGSFQVALRPNGTFYCEKYPAQAKWQVVDNKLQVDWKNFGQYEFVIGTSPVIEGSLVGNPSNWRKMSFARAFTETETALLGAGFGSVWDFAWEGGSFEVEFRVDGYNHFICQAYPAHSHWNISEDQTVYVNWGQYGEYVLKLDAATRTLQGHGKGQPDNWRKATFLRALNPADSSASVPSHDHDHVHGEGCGHSHGHSGKDCCDHEHHDHGKGGCNHSH